MHGRVVSLNLTLMCGRFVRSSSVETYAEIFGAESGCGLEPSYNIAPSQTVLAARSGNTGRELALLHWGLVPPWAKDKRMAYSTINARAESVAFKPAFRAAYRKRRCLIAADGFYEWKRLPDSRQPYFIGLKSGEPFAFAGLWERWEKGDEVIESCTIIVTEANELLADVHARMPVILPAESYEAWLEPQRQEPENLNAYLRPFPAALMQAFPVSLRVNSPRNDDEGLLARVEPEQ